MNTKEKIISAAKSMFARYGFRKTTVKEIASSALVVKGAFYHYFKSKEDLLEFIVIEDLLEARRITIETLGSFSSPRERLIAFLKTSMIEVRKRAYVYVALKTEFESAPFVEALKERVVDALKAIIRELIECGVEDGSFKRLDLEEVAETLTTIHGAYIFSPSIIKSSEEEVEQRLAVYVKIVCDGITS